MDCDDVDRTSAIERYLTDQLVDAELELFEQHYLSCPRCFAQLEVYDDAQRVLARSVPASAGATTRAQFSIRRLWPLAAAAVVVLGVAVTLRQPGAPIETSRTEPTPAPAVNPSPALPASNVPDHAQALARLGEVRPPVFAPAVTRSTSSETAAFSRAMEAYQARDWRAAADQLTRVVDRPNAPLNAHLYLAAAWLLSGDDGAASAPLQTVVAAGDTPFLEDARLLLAKLAIRQGDTAAARRELAAVVSLNGDLMQEARRLLTELDRLPPQ